MKARAWARAIALLVVALPAVVACEENLGQGVSTGGLAAIACPELTGSAASASFTSDAKANATVRAFVMASGDLMRVAAHVEDEVSAACTRMAQDLGVPPEQARASNEAGGRAAAPCRAVGARIDAILREGASANVKVTATPPECRAEADAYASCAGQCNVSVDPGYVVAHCEPAQLSGTCEGTCSGECDGACHGACNGQCSAKDASGQCAGKCAGTCNGRCDATCHARCEGTWKAPRCATQVKAPSADAKCDASCRAHANLEARCTPARVDVRSTVNAGELPRLAATLQANLPALIDAEVAYGRRIGADVDALVQVGADLPNVLGDVGAHAAACIAASADAVARAQAQLRVSVQVSAEVTGKVHAGTG